MHLSVKRWCAAAVNRFDLASRNCLEIGSLDVNGTTRDLFHAHYLGVDMRPGPGVDVIGNAEALPFPSSSWPVVISTEMLEHCARPWLAVAEMARVLEPGGILLLTCRGYDTRGCFPVHDHPADYWRFSAAGLAGVVQDCGLVGRAALDPTDPGVFVAARKVRGDG